MRLPSPAWWVVGLLCGALSAPAQGTFQDLDFESATVVPVAGRPGDYEFAQAFPGWTGYIGGVQEGLILYNNLTLSDAGLSIIDTAYRPVLGNQSPGGLIQGNYTAVLMSGAAGVNQSADATLAQTGLVPLGANSLLFKAHFDPYNSSGSFGVTLGGQTLSLTPLQAGTNYTLYGADIRGWQGKTAALDFTVFAYPQQINADYLFLDSIQFSDQVLPEPGVLSLSVLGALLLGGRALGRRR